MFEAHDDGYQNVVANLNLAAKQAMKILAPAAVGIAVMLIRRTAGPLTPKDEGNLRRSQRSRLDKTGTAVVGTIYYEASYAVFVHEIDKAYHEPGTQWKYLETAIQMERERILEVFKGNFEVANWKTPQGPGGGGMEGLEA